jgi:uncharacterized protein (TIGR03118 family)
MITPSPSPFSVPAIAVSEKRNVRWDLAARSLIAAFACATSVAFAAGFVETDLVANKKPLTDANGIVHTAVNVDANLLNPWGVGESTGSPFWVSDNGAGASTLYNTAGTPQQLVVFIPGPAPADASGSDGTPTGLVFNIAQGQSAFKITGVNRLGASTTLPAVFLFATEDGTILGWNPGVAPSAAGFTGPNNASAHAIIAVPAGGAPPGGAVYKGLAIAMVGVPPNQTPLLCATNFHAGTIEVYDASFQPAKLPSGAFVDPALPRGYAPFNIVPVGARLFVTYAIQDADAHDDVAGQGHGIVDTFNLDGTSPNRFAQHGQLDSPWGVAVAPASFGEFAGDILIGNFGNGHINVFDPTTGEFLNKLRNSHGQAIVIDGLWTLKVGNGGNGGDVNLVYFTAGPNGESDGLFGSLGPSP